MWSFLKKHKKRTTLEHFLLLRQDNCDESVKFEINYR